MSSRARLAVSSATIPVGEHRAKGEQKVPIRRGSASRERPTGAEGPLLNHTNGEQTAKGEQKANRDNRKFKNLRNPLQPKDISKVNRDKNSSLASPHLRPSSQNSPVHDGEMELLKSTTLR